MSSWEGWRIQHDATGLIERAELDVVRFVTLIVTPNPHKPGRYGWCCEIANGDLAAFGGNHHSAEIARDVALDYWYCLGDEVIEEYML